MTTIDTINPARGAVRPRDRGTTSPRPKRGSIPLVAVALAASLAGGIVGAAATVAVPNLTRDPAAEQAKWLEFADQFERAIRWDDLWKQMHPERS